MSKSHVLGTSVKIHSCVTSIRDFLENQLISQGAEESKESSLNHDPYLYSAYWLGVTKLASTWVDFSSHYIRSILKLNLLSLLFPDIMQIKSSENIFSGQHLFINIVSSWLSTHNIKEKPVIAMILTLFDIQVFIKLVPICLLAMTNPTKWVSCGRVITTTLESCLHKSFLA